LSLQERAMAYESEAVPASMDLGRRGDDIVLRWGGVMAGCFVTLSSLVLLGEIGATLGLSAFEPGDRAAHYAWGAGPWGLVTAAAAFFLGGGASSCVSRLHRRDGGLLQGALVWAVAVPLIGFLGAVLALGAVTAASVTAAAGVTIDAATPPPDPLTPAERQDATRARREATKPETIREASKAAGTVGWAMVGALLLSLGAAAFGGWLGAHHGPRAGPRRADGELPETGGLRQRD
jgi:hypothetical protein